MNEKVFKAYDIRGIYPAEINGPIVKRIAQAYVKHFQPKIVAVGRDVRISGPELQRAVIEGLIESGVEVIDIGAVPTEMLYFAVGYYHYDGGIQVSASHNPAEYNGLKMVTAGVEAVSSDAGLNEIKELVMSDDDLSAPARGQLTSKSVEEDYLDYLTKFVEFDLIGPTKIVVNANFGLSGRVAEKLLTRLGIENIQLVKINFEPDGTFPKGRPDPMIIENRQETSELVRSSKADLAVCWDADGDRCFFADENGEFIEGCHLTALLAKELLEKSPGGKIIYDPRNVWAVEETIVSAGGVPVINKAGHTFIKARMKKENALFAGEMSGHFYFRDFYFADNGIIPFLLILSMLTKTKQPLSMLSKDLREKYIVSGEINFTVADIKEKMSQIEKTYEHGAIDRTDGLSVSFDTWRFNLRASNTEPLLRLNVEALDKNICQEKTVELSRFLEAS